MQSAAVNLITRIHERGSVSEEDFVLALGDTWYAEFVASSVGKVLIQATKTVAMKNIYLKAVVILLSSIFIANYGLTDALRDVLDIIGDIAEVVTGAAEYCMGMPETYFLDWYIYASEL